MIIRRARVDYKKRDFKQSKTMTKYYDPEGNYKAYTNDDKHLFTASGEHIGSFSNGFLYDPKGMAIGRIKEKYILDKKGQPLYYTN